MTKEDSTLFENKVYEFFLKNGVEIQNLSSKQGTTDLFSKKIGCIECTVAQEDDRKNAPINSDIPRYSTDTDKTFQNVSEDYLIKVTDYIATRIATRLLQKSGQIEKHIQGNKHESQFSRIVCLTFNIEDLPVCYRWNDLYEDALMKLLYGLKPGEYRVEGNNMYYIKNDAKIIKNKRSCDENVLLDSSVFSLYSNISALLFVYPILIHRQEKSIANGICSILNKDESLQAEDFILFVNPKAEVPLDKTAISCFERMGIHFFDSKIGVIRHEQSTYN